MEEMKNVIELKNVSKDYGDFKLDNISFEVPEGCVCGFIGQNGAGKTTLMRCIAGLYDRYTRDVSLIDSSGIKNKKYFDYHHLNLILIYLLLK